MAMQTPGLPETYHPFMKGARSAASATMNNWRANDLRDLLVLLLICSLQNRQV
jgi:hypothetical protein